MLKLVFLDFKTLIVLQNLRFFLFQMNGECLDLVDDVANVEGVKLAKFFNQHFFDSFLNSFESQNSLRVQSCFAAGSLSHDGLFASLEGACQLVQDFTRFCRKVFHQILLKAWFKSTVD